MAACKASNKGPTTKTLLSFDIGVKNLACCAFTVSDQSDTARLHYWNVLSLAAEKERIPCVNELALRLFSALDDLVTELKEPIDIVLLENQPSRLNGAMKSIQMMIYSYFQLRRHWEGLCDSVHMISASQKLLGHTHTIPEPDQKKSLVGYKLNKWRGIQYASKYIEGCDKLCAYFNSNKKKDDLADAMLQGLSWARKHGYMVEACVETDIKNLS